jgi:hypothetical protein
MKAIEKVIGINLNDLKVAVPAIKEVYSRLTKEYADNTHPKLKILDSLIVFSIATFAI